MKFVKDINLLPDYVTQKRVTTKNRTNIAFMILLYTCIIIIIFLIPLGISKYYKSKELIATKQFNSLSYVQKKVDLLNKNIAAKDKKQSILKKVSDNQIKIVELLDKINNAIPYGVVMKSFSINAKDVSVSFIITTPTMLIDLINSLENTKLFQNVVVNTFPMKDMDYTVSFKLKLK